MKTRIVIDIDTKDTPRTAIGCALRTLLASTLSRGDRQDGVPLSIGGGDTCSYHVTVTPE